MFSDIINTFNVLQEKESLIPIRDGSGTEFLHHNEVMKKGVLLMHGFGGSPPEMSSLGEHLHQNGMNVLNLRLAAHGTSIADFAKSSVEGWLASVGEGFSLINSASENVTIIGQSLGGALSLVYASEHECEKVVSLAAPIYFQNRRIFLTQFRIIRALFPNIKIEVSENEKLFVYDRRPTVAVSQILKLRARLIRQLPELNQPLLVCHAKGDPVVKFSSAGFIFNRVGSVKKELLELDLYQHRLSLSQEARDLGLYDRIVNFVEAEY